MGNCLKIQLKESVSNTNLEVLGSFRVTTASGAVFILTYYPTKVGSVNSINNSSVSVTDVNVFELSNYPNVPANTILECTNKYELKQISSNQLSSFNIECLQYSKMTHILCRGLGTFGDLNTALQSSFNYLTELDFQGSHVVADIYDILSQAPNLVKYYCADVAESTGTLDSLLPLTLNNALVIDVTGTGVTTTQSALDTLRGRGITIYIDNSQINP